MSETLSNLSHEERRFPPPEEFAEQANVKRRRLRRGRRRPAGVLGQGGRAAVLGRRSGTEVLDWSRRAVREVVRRRRAQRRLQLRRPARRGRARRPGRLSTGRASRATPARSPTPSSRTRSARRRTRWSNWACSTGDRVAIYMPMIPETVVAMLACARLGAPHTVVFGGFSSTALSDRIIDCDAHVVITADGGYRRGAPSALKPAVDEALREVPGRAHRCWWCAAPARTSTGPTGATCGGTTSSTGSRPSTRRVLRRRAPAVRHVHLGHDRQAEGHPAHLRRLPDPGGVDAPRGLRPQAGRRPVLVRRRHRLGHRPQLHRVRPAGQPGHVVHVRGHAEHARTKHRWWEMIEKYKITILYTAPTTIRTFMKWGEDIPSAHDLSSLRLLGSVGEPINPEAWIWYRREHRRRPHAGRRHLVADRDRRDHDQPAAGRHRRPSPARRCGRCPGISAEVVDNEGKPGAQRRRRPARAHRAVAVDDRAASGATRTGSARPTGTRFAEQGYYFAGDGAKKDDDGDLWLLGRVDDVMNVSGHRISTTEVESALVSHPAVAEAAVVGRHRPDHRPGHRRVRHPARQRPDRGARGRAAGQDAARPRGQGDRRRSPSRARS